MSTPTDTRADLEQMRKEFDAWALSTGQFTQDDMRRYEELAIPVDTLKGRYCNMALEDMWIGYQARASRTIEVTDEMAIQGAWGPINARITALGEQPFHPAVNPSVPEIERARLILIAALSPNTGGRDETV